MREDYEKLYKELKNRMKAVAASCEATAYYDIADMLRDKNTDDKSKSSEAYLVAAGWIKSNLKGFID